jgi:hypothetical protein
LRGEELTLNTLTRANLEFPLSRHDLSVGTGDLDTGEQASFEVSLDNISAEDLSGTNTTVVWTLWAWEASDWPAIWSVAHVEKGVLLLKTEPWLVGCVRLHELGTLVAVVELVGGAISVPALSDDQNVGCTAEWVGEDSDGPKINIGVVAWSLAGRATIEVPFWEILNLEDTALGDRSKSLQNKSVTIYSRLIPTEGSGRLLTFDLDRTPPVESTQMYLYCK